jgi:S1-C subfamily serine protease
LIDPTSQGITIMRTLRRGAALLAVLLIAGVALPDAGELTRVQVARIGKASTALVECDIFRGKSHGSAFCVHSSGLFVTNEHVIRGAAQVRLILDPSLKTQKVVKAKVLRSDRDADLALLQAEGVKDLPALTLGAADGLNELQEIIAVGFPFGKALTLVRDEYPAASINVGSITSLRKKGGELHRIQVDVALNPVTPAGRCSTATARWWVWSSPAFAAPGSTS